MRDSNCARALSTAVVDSFDALTYHLESSPAGEDLFIEPSGRRLRSDAYADRCRRVASGLINLGLPKGARVGVLSLNSIEYMEIVLATALADLIVVPLNVRWSRAEFLYAANQVRIEALVFDQTFRDTAAAIASETSSIRFMIFVGHPTTVMRSDIVYESLLAEPIKLNPTRDPEQECAIVYTGGTTGRPKGAVHCHRSLLASATMMATNNFPLASRCFMTVMPMFHISGFGVVIARLLQKAPTLIVPVFRPEEIGPLVSRFDVGSSGMAPIMLQMILHQERLDAAQFDRMEQVIYGASPMSDDLLRSILGTFPHARLTQAYGMTEAGIGIFLRPEFHVGPLARSLAAGQAGSPNMHIAIEGSDGQTVPRGEIGEVVLYTNSLMKRYFENEDETRAAIRDGGYRTGDVGYLDSLGVLFLKDRAKDMIVTGGENVFSAEVENAIADHPEVVAVAVIGIPDPEYGEAVHAVIVPRSGSALSYEDIRKHARKSIAGYKCPRSISVVEQLPLSAANKVLKHVLREPFWKDQDRSIA